MPLHFHVFQTAHGFAAIGWNGAAITSFRLPAPTAIEAERALIRRHPYAMPAEPPETTRTVIDAATRYFAGERIDFAAVPIDLGAQEPFFGQVYAHVRALAYGQSTTYGAVARALGAEPQAAQAVGQAMANNPIPLIVPCHRVTAAGGKVGGFSAPGGSLSKARMLELEGVSLSPPAKENPQATFSF